MSGAFSRLWKIRSLLWLSSIISGLESDKVAVNVLLDSSFKAGFSLSPRVLGVPAAACHSSVTLQNCPPSKGSASCNDWMVRGRRGYRHSAPFAQFGTTRRTNLALELAVRLAEVSVAPASIQIIPRLKPASLTPIQELFYSTLPN